MLIFESIRLAISSIRINKMRSFLTMLGMVIGISSVIAIVSLGDTMRGAIASEFEAIGTNAAFSYIVSENGYYTENEMFTFDEIDRIKKDFGDDIAYISASANGQGSVINNRKNLEARFMGLAENPTAAYDLKMVHGRMFTDSDIKNGRQYIIIEDKTSMELFGTKNSVGKELRVKVNEEMLDFVVTGVYENTDSAMKQLMGGPSRYAMTYVPEKTITNEGDSLWQLSIYSKKDIDVSAFSNKFTKYIAKIKNQEQHNVIYYTAESQMAMMDGMLASLSMIVGAIAAISLLVGGIGIMNIMLVSVTERTREIGIRKALGARTEDILFQFLVESAIISTLGGLIGTSLGIGVIALGGMVVGLEVVINPITVLVAVVFSGVVGVFFGIYPARKAAKADPITALRYE